MPFVPQVLGVPPLSSYAPDAAVPLLTSDALSFIASLFGPPWGIFLAGVPVVVADSVISMEFKQEWSISNYPVEQGAFESYDRVSTPFEARFRFAAGGDVGNRAALLASIQAITGSGLLGSVVNAISSFLTGSLPLYDVVTPEGVYPSVSISHYDYRRTAQNGVGLLQVDVWCKQVVVSTTTQFSSTQNPSGADPQGGGVVQPSQPTADQSASIGDMQ